VRTDLCFEATSDSTTEREEKKNRNETKKKDATRKTTQQLNTCCMEKTPSDQVQRILNAENYFELFELPIETVEPKLVKKAYKKLALFVHPDKCKDPNSSEAFKKLTQAFDTLSNAENQHVYLFQ
jgi:DnaJ family protein B protein 12